MHTAPQYITPQDLRRKATAAAALAMRGASYSPDDRADAAATIAARIMAEVDGPAWSDFRPAAPNRAAVLRMIDRVWSGELHPASVAIPAEVASFSRMSGMAANLRRSIDRDRARANQSQGERAADGFALPPRTSEEDRAALLSELASISPDAAHRAALGAVDALGVSGEYAAYVLAYCALRSKTDAQGKLVGARAALAELDAAAGEDGPKTDAAAEKRTSRALSAGRKSVPSWQHPRWDGQPRECFNAHLDACQLLDSEGYAAKASRTRNLSADLDTADRTTQNAALRAGLISEEVNASKTRKLSAAQIAAALRRSAERAPDTTVGPRTARHWREYLTDTQRARLHRAAEIRREHASADGADARDTANAERGTEYAVR